MGEHSGKFKCRAGRKDDDMDSKALDRRLRQCEEKVRLELDRINEHGNHEVRGHYDAEHRRSLHCEWEMMPALKTKVREVLKDRIRITKPLILRGPRGTEVKTMEISFTRKSETRPPSGNQN